MFDSAFERQMQYRDSYVYCLEDTPITDQQFDVTVLKCCDPLGVLITGSNDAVVRLYDN